MSSAESSNEQKLLQRVSTPLFLFLCLLLVPAAIFASVLVGVIVCVIAGVENSDLQAGIGLAAQLVGFVGSIYLLLRARRSPVSRPQQAQMTASGPPPLPIAQEVQNVKSRSEGPTKVSGYEAAVEPDSEDVVGDLESDPPSHRIIDWVKVFTTPILILTNAATLGLLGAIALGQTKSATNIQQVLYVACLIILFAAPILFLSSILSQLLGTYFNVARDRLSYPYYAWRLRLPISAIQDANAQTINKRGVDYLASMGEKNIKHKTIHHYHVNLSGDFGARRLMFRSKFKRDQFLSILRAIRPDVRITRWS
jgi:hypothetical protein